MKVLKDKSCDQTSLGMPPETPLWASSPFNVSHSLFVSLFLAYHQPSACLITLIFVWTNYFPCDTFLCWICFKFIGEK